MKSESYSHTQQNNIHLASIETFILRFPLATPVRTSFGVMPARPAVFVRVTDRDGISGWGEAWCNFPACAAEYRQALITEVLSPLACKRIFPSPQALFASLSQQTAVLTLQSGDHGPMAQAIAAIDIAVWDMCARKAGQPLWRYLGGSQDTVTSYASGINPTGSEELIRQKIAEGYNAFKMKVGFDSEQDYHSVSMLREIIGHDRRLMLDANQGWSPQDALASVLRLAEFSPLWIEEPLRADSTPQTWRELAEGSPIPLAAGENIAGHNAFCQAMDNFGLRVIQPDIAKWGGLSGVLALLPEIKRRQLQYCPHYLGGGIGLLASAHLLAASDMPDGMLEVDANPNPLRHALCGPLAHPVQGVVALGDAAGLGIEPDIDAIRDRLAG